MFVAAASTAAVAFPHFFCTIPASFAARLARDACAAFAFPGDCGGEAAAAETGCCDGTRLRRPAQA